MSGLKKILLEQKPKKKPVVSKPKKVNTNKIQPAPTTAPGEKTSSLRPRLARPNRNNSTTAADGRCMSMVTELICLLIFNLRVQFVFPDTETYKRTKIY